MINIPDPSTTDPISQPQPDDSTTKSSSSDKKKPDKDAKSFSKMLAEKADKSGKKSETPQADAPPSFRETAPVVQQAKQTAAAAPLTPAMQNLVQEISVARTKDRTQVDIQLNSKTFDGLKVTISQTAGNVSIQMVSRTPEVAALLTRHVDQLSQALSARGVPVASIRVRTADARGGRGGRQG
jgi:flagellar hook-length control protein FliK